MIPKIIHYCWFGKNPKPKLAEKCINSWKKHCGEYQIIEWNEENFDILSAPLYVRQAYEARKWAFVTDYVRLLALTQYGGVYMDTDVEVIKSLDKFLEEKAFSGFEAKDRIPTGIMACEKGFELFDIFLNEYEHESFYNDDGSFNTITNVTRITNFCLKNGLILNGEKQTIDGFTLYPVDYFCPLNYDTGKLKKTCRTHTIHWFNGSWQSETEKKKHQDYIAQERRNRIKQIIIGLSAKIIGADRTEELRSWVKR